MKIGTLLVCLGMAAGGLSSGCSLFQGACAKTTVLVDGAMVHITDGATALDQVEARFLLLPTEERVFGLRLVEKGRVALRAAQESLLAAKSACEEPNLVVVFAEFVEAWQAIDMIFKGTPVEVGAPSVVGVVMPGCGRTCKVKKGE